MLKSTCECRSWEQTPLMGPVVNSGPWFFLPYYQKQNLGVQPCFQTCMGMAPSCLKGSSVFPPWETSLLPPGDKGRIAKNVCTSDRTFGYVQFSMESALEEGDSAGSMVYVLALGAMLPVFPEAPHLRAERSGGSHLMSSGLSRLWNGDSNRCEG